MFCASSERMAPQYYEAAEALGRWIGESGKTLVYGGANCGLVVRFLVWCQESW